MFCLFKSIFLYFAMLFRCLRFFFFFSGLICFFLFKSFFVPKHYIIAVSLSLAPSLSLRHLYHTNLLSKEGETVSSCYVFYTRANIFYLHCVCVIVRKVHTISIFTQHFIKILNEHDTTKTKCASDIAV